MQINKIKIGFIVILAAWLTNIIQAGLLSNLSLFGGQPNLIAIGAVVFLVMKKFNLGLIWIGFGGGYFDTILGSFGITTLPLLAAYVVLYLLIRHIFNNLPWVATIIIGLILIAASEIILVMRFGDLDQLSKDLLFGLVILVPLTLWLRTKNFKE